MERAALRLEEVGSRAERTEGAENRRQPGRTETMQRKGKQAWRGGRSDPMPGRRKGQVTLEFFPLRRYLKVRKEVGEGSGSQG